MREGGPLDWLGRRSVYKPDFWVSTTGGRGRVVFYWFFKGLSNKDLLLFMRNGLLPFSFVTILTEPLPIAGTL